MGERSGTGGSTTGPTNYYEPIGYVDVIVTDTKSDPIPGAAVRLFMGESKIDEKTTNNEGRASFTVQAYTFYRVEVEKAGYARKSAEVYVIEGYNTVALSLEYRVIVTVLDNTNNRPIAGARVTFYWLDEEGIFSGVTDSQGKAVLELYHRRHELVVEKDGYATHSEIVNVDRPDMNITVRLNPSRRLLLLEVTVVDYKRRPIGGATVTVYRDGQRVDSKVTGTDGKVTFQLEQGTYTIEASKTGYKQPAQISVTLDRDKSEQLTLRGYTLTVTVRDSATRQPISGATVKVFDQSTGREVDSGTTA